MYLSQPRSLALLVLAIVSIDVGAQDDIARVEVAVPQVADFGERFSVSGSVTAERAAQLSPRVDGLVAEVLVDAGDRVEQGDLLIRLDHAVGRQALARAAAQAEQSAAAVAESERLFAEAQRLGERNFIPASQVDTREAELTLARAALASSRAAEREQAELVRRHDLPAPFAGVIAEKMTEAGEWVQRGTPVLSLVAIDRVRIDAQIPQERYSQIDGSAQVTVFPDAVEGNGDSDGLRAEVGAKVPVTDPGARTFLLRLLVDDAAGRLLPGTSARAVISLPAREPALAVPRDALLRQPDGSYSLFVVETDGEDRTIARQRSIRVLRDQGDQVAVAAGLERGEQVVIRGNEALGDGQRVRVVED